MRQEGMRLRMTIDDVAGTFEVKDEMFLEGGYTYGTWMMRLFTVGFALIPSCQRNYDAEEVEEWFSEFGSVNIDEGRQRVQVASRDDGTWLASVFQTACAAAGVIGMREFHGANVYGLRTRRGWTVPQDPHTDYPHGKVVHLLKDPLRVPISAIWAACDDFVLMDYSYNVERRVPTGMIAVFRADWWHGGGVGVSNHLRVHGYGAQNGFNIANGATYDAFGDKHV